MKEMSVARRLALLATGGGLWLLLAVTPVFADGGPHVLTNNNGTSGLGGDCAACHRAHTAQAADLLKEELPGLCVSCHNGTGATTDVVDGLQYLPDADGTPTTTVLGALRGGGFDYALIDSDSAARIYSDFPIANRGHVGVLAASARQATTSKHEGEGTVWGNGAIDSGPGPATGSAIVLDCARCHNPHGNGFYRILNPEPGEDFLAPFAVSRPGGVEVTETTPTTLAAGQVRNYTVLPGNLTSDVVTAGYTAAQGDYWRRFVPDWRTSLVRDPMQTGWNGSSPTTAGANGGTPPSAFTGLMTAWCLQCHTRYSGLIDLLSGLPPALAPTDDDLFKYRHDTMNLGCEQCHVSHGSNAVMQPGTASADMPWPAWPPAASGTGNNDSRLLKIDNRGTCQMCHDPTGTINGGQYTGPIPSPSAP